MPELTSEWDRGRRTGGASYGVRLCGAAAALATRSAQSEEAKYGHDDHNETDDVDDIVHFDLPALTGSEGRHGLDIAPHRPTRR